MYFSPDVPSKELPGLVNEYRRTWAQIIGGFALLLGLYLTWRRVEISQRTLEATQDQQVTERFTRAIDQFGATDDDTGSPRLEIRLGGIYALERIAKDSPERDYSPIMKILTAYIRENAPWPKALMSRSGKHNDIQAILDVLRRREEDRVPERERLPPDLRNTNLSGANLSIADLPGILLSKSNLSGTILFGANLSPSDLSETDLSGAQLAATHLANANLAGADLKLADLRGADLSNAMLSDADLYGATLHGTNLSGAYLYNAINLTQIQIEEAEGNENTKLPEGLTQPEAWRGNSEE